MFTTSWVFQWTSNKSSRIPGVIKSTAVCNIMNKVIFFDMRISYRPSNTNFQGHKLWSLCNKTFVIRGPYWKSWATHSYNSNFNKKQLHYHNLQTVHVPSLAFITRPWAIFAKWLTFWQSAVIEFLAKERKVCYWNSPGLQWAWKPAL